MRPPSRGRRAPPDTGTAPSDGDSHMTTSTGIDNLSSTAAAALLRESAAHPGYGKPPRHRHGPGRVASSSSQSEGAWDILVTVSQHANIKLRAIADAVTAAASGQPTRDRSRRRQRAEGLAHPRHTAGPVTELDDCRAVLRPAVPTVAARPRPDRGDVSAPSPSGSGETAAGVSDRTP